MQKKEDKKPKVVNYLLFCESCGCPKKIPEHIIKTYFVTEGNGVYCDNESCNHKTIIPDYLKKLDL